MNCISEFESQNANSHTLERHDALVRRGSLASTPLNSWHATSGVEPHEGVARTLIVEQACYSILYLISGWCAALL